MMKHLHDVAITIANHQSPHRQRHPARIMIDRVRRPLLDLIDPLSSFTSVSLLLINTCSASLGAFSYGLTDL
jgi:hypothetical protein